MFTRRTLIHAIDYLTSPKSCWRAKTLGKLPGLHISSFNSADIPSIEVVSTSNSSYRGPCTVSGWIKSAKHQSKHSFLHLTDGLSSRHVQVVLPADIRGDVSKVKFGASVKVTGTLADSPAKGQNVEIQATNIQILGSCNNDDYPFANLKKSSDANFVRKHLHLRPKKPEFAAMLRLRNASRKAIFDHFQKKGYVHIDTPILTSNDCEGAGETFAVSATEMAKDKEPYFGKEQNVNLTVSGQLHLEVCSAGISKVFSFGPTFRADHSTDRTHLAEFYMVEGEISFMDNLDDLMYSIEDLTKSVAKDILENEQENIHALHQGSTGYEPTDVSRYLTAPFHRLCYADAIQLLNSASQVFEMQPKFGDDLHREHEHYIVQAHDYLPVFITNWPKKLKPFYMYANDDGETVACMDLIVPGPGELFGGSLREHRYDELKARLERNDLVEEYSWYLDLRRYGSVPHAGFGMGFERFLQFLFGIRQIRDTLPFPRYQRNCRL